MKTYLLILSFMSFANGTEEGFDVSAFPADWQEEIVAVVEAYIQGADQRDLAQLEGALHADFRVVVNQFMGGEDAAVLPRAVYLGMIKDEKLGGTARIWEITEIKVTKHTATVDLVMESESAHFRSHLNLVQHQDGSWKLISDLTVFEPK